MKSEQLNHKLAEVELINPYEKDSEAYANWDFGNSIIGLARAIKELEEEYEEYDKIYHNPKLTKSGSEEERELHDKLWALDCNLCVLRARIKEKEYAELKFAKSSKELRNKGLVEEKTKTKKNPIIEFLKDPASSLSQNARDAGAM